MKHYLFSLTFSILVSSLIFGQEDQSYRLGGLGYASIGGQSLSFNDSNSPLQSLSVFPDNLNLQFGGGGFILLDSKYIIKGQGYGSIFQLANTSVASLNSTFGGGGLNLGYAFINKNDLLLFPTVGIGASGYNLEVENISATNLLFGNEVISPNQVTEYQLFNAYLDLNLNLHRLFDFGKDDDDIGGFSLGLSLGYQLPINDGTWKNLSTNNEIQNLENNSASAFYIKLLIGGGGFSL